LLTRFALFLLTWFIPFTEQAQLCILGVGDWGSQNPNVQRVADVMATFAEQCNATMTISTGDHFYHHGIASSNDPRFKTHFEQQFHHPSLQHAWYLVLGNHDLNYVPKIQRGYDRIPDARKALAQIEYSKRNPRWHMPSRFYTHQEGVSCFLFLDTVMLHVCILGADGCEEGWTIWVQKELHRSTLNESCKWVIVVGHWSIKSSYPHYYPAFEAWLCPLLESARAHKPVVYLCGDNHFMQVTEEREVLYLTSGAGGGTKRHAGRQQHPGVVLGKNSHLFPHLGFMTLQFYENILQLSVIDARLGSVVEIFNYSANAPFIKLEQRKSYLQERHPPSFMPLAAAPMAFACVMCLGVLVTRLFRKAIRI